MSFTPAYFSFFAFFVCLAVPLYSAHSLVPLDHAHSNVTNGTTHTHRHGSSSLVIVPVQNKTSSVGNSTIPPASKTVSKRQVSNIVKVSNSKDLQKALDNAGPGTKIQLEAGKYHGPFTAENNGNPENPIVLTGEKREDTVIIGTKQGTAFTISGDFYQISNLTIRDSKVGVKLQGMESYLKNLIIDQTEAGLKVEGKGGHVLESSLIHCSKELVTGETELLIQHNNLVEPCFENIH